MERTLVVLGTLFALSAIGYGVVEAGGRGVKRRPTARTAPAARPTPAPSSDVVDWSSLTAYEYQKDMAGLPDPLKALDGKTVKMRGFLLPLYQFDDIKEFILVANHMSCCFGIPAGMNGQVYVKVSGDRGLPNTNEPIEVTGTFHARERTEQGYVLSIFEVVDAAARIVGY